MNLTELFCPNPDCPAKGRRNEGNITIHSQTEQHCCCGVCIQTFSITKGALFYRLKTLVITLLPHGCPLQAIVAAFGYDELSSRPQTSGGTEPA